MTDASTIKLAELVARDLQALAAAEPERWRALADKAAAWLAEIRRPASD